MKRTTRSLATVAVAILWAGGSVSLAQNASQRAALDRLGLKTFDPETLGLARTQGSEPESGVEATSVSLQQPGGLCFDRVGNLYIADTDNNLIREVNLFGIITTVAGDGEQGFAGDGGAATGAVLDSPTGVAVDGSGNVFIADTHNNRIREVSAGVIQTIAGTGVAGFSGDGGGALSAKLNYPTSIAVDSKGDVYIADTNNCRIRKIAGKAISTVAGNGQQSYFGDGGQAIAAGLDSPSGVAVDGSLNLYISDTRNQRVRMVAAGTSIITTVAGTGVEAFSGDGVASNASLARPRGLTAGTGGILYVADSDNDRIRSINKGNLTTVAGNGTEGDTGDSGPATDASLDTPRAVTAFEDAIVFSDTRNDRIRSSTAGVVDTIAGLAPKTNETLTLGSETSIVYGTGTLTATFLDSGDAAIGRVTFYDGLGPSPVNIGSASLISDVATISTKALSAGTHFIVASYVAEAGKRPIVSGVYGLTIAPLAITANVGTIDLRYGQLIPEIKGTLIGVLAQDSAKVFAVFTTPSTDASPPGTYPISVSLAGSAAANYTVTMGAEYGSLIIAKAPSITTLRVSNATPIFGTLVTLTAAIASSTSGTPSGTVSFYNGSTLLNLTPAALAGGRASISIATLPLGALQLTAIYSGSSDFLTSTSTVVSGQELSPDFTIATTPAVQQVVPAQPANYTVTLTPINPTFLYPVSLSASGLPSGVKAIFSPPSVRTGGGVSTVTLTVNNLNNGMQARLQKLGRPLSGRGTSAVLALLLLPFTFLQRVRRVGVKLRGKPSYFLALLAVGALCVISGCGGGGGFFGHLPATYTITVTAVSGPNTHTSTLYLTVQ